MIFELQNIDDTEGSDAENVREDEDEFSSSNIMVTQDDQVHDANQYSSEIQHTSKNEGLKQDTWMFKTFDKKVLGSSKQTQKSKRTETE